MSVQTDVERRKKKYSGEKEQGSKVSMRGTNEKQGVGKKLVMFLLIFPT